MSRRPQKYVRYSGLRPQDFEPEVDGVPSTVEIIGWCIAAAIFGVFVSYFL